MDASDEVALVDALIVATKMGLPTDIQALLLEGDPMRGIEPGILRAMLRAAT